MLSQSPTEQGAPSLDQIMPGSAAHKKLFCRMLLDTFDPYRPSVIAWPELAPDALQRLVSLPFWDLAVATEERAARRMEALAEACDDDLIREAVALNAWEERRHKEVLGHMIRYYGIPLKGETPDISTGDPVWGFVRTGYGECLDSFFAFGLFALARQSGFFPEPLVEVFEPVIQEEARHNLFFVNWVAWRRGSAALPRRVALDLQCLAALAVQVSGRIGLARTVDDRNFTRTGGDAVGLRLSTGAFFRLCLAEHDRRLAPYDPRLLRPRIMPSIARAVSRMLPG